jgi:hypothetical protein
MNRLFYIDNLRIGLITLVVIHHLAITYGGPGGWYYIENPPDQYSSFLYALFLATNQAFFMGFFFFISAYFTAISLERKHTRVFVKDRLVRLGVPLLVYYFILSPITIYLLVRYARGDAISFFDFTVKHHGFGFGPMWFVEALLYFTFLYILYRVLFQKKLNSWTATAQFPGTVPILLFAMAIGTVTFIVRLWFPVGYVFDPLGFQPPHFSQYIALFALGIAARQYNWLEKISYRRGVLWFAFAVSVVLIGFPVLFISGGAASGNLNPFMGGMTWQALGYAVWEQLVCMSMIIGLTGIFQKKFNYQTNLNRQLSAAAYLVFIIHPVVLVGLCVVLKDVEIYHLLKFFMLAPVMVVLCFGTAMLLRKIPGVNRVV